MQEDLVSGQAAQGQEFVHSTVFFEDLVIVSAKQCGECRDLIENQI